MTTVLRRALLVSSTALIALTLMPVTGDMLPGRLSAYVDQQAQARGGDDDGDDDSGDDDSGGSDRDSSDHDSSDDDSDDDDSSGRDDDDSDDDSRDRSNGNSKSRGRGGDDDRVRLIVNDAQLNGLLSGSMIAVDQNGKRLRFEVEKEHGNTEIKLRARQGTLTGVTVIPAP